MSWFLRILIFVPAVFCVMAVYSAPAATTASGVVQIAVRKTVKVVAWSAVLVVVMYLIEALLLP